MRSDPKFAQISGIGGLAPKLVETGKYKLYPRVYLLLKLALVLSVPTATMKRIFSAINVVYG